MNRHRRQFNPVLVALYLNAALMGILILVVLGRDSNRSILPAAVAQQQGNIAGGAGIFVMPGQFSATAWGCYLLDVDQQTLCLYQYMPGDKNLRLIAARNFQYDRRLRMFNTDPDPQMIRDLLEKEANPSRQMNPEAPPVSPEG